MWPTVFEADGGLAAGTITTARCRYMQSIVRARRVHEVSAWQDGIGAMWGSTRAGAIVIETQ